MPRRLRSERAACCLVALLLPLSAAAQPSAAIASALGGLRWGMRLGDVQRKLKSELRAVAQPPAFLRHELASRSDEVWLRREAMSQTFQVYRAGKLRMLYTLFEPLAFPEGNFAAFSASLQRRFGPAKWHSSVEQGRWVEWQDRSTRVRAIDQTNTYGFYCLILQARE